MKDKDLINQPELRWMLAVLSNENPEHVDRGNVEKLVERAIGNGLGAVLYQKIVDKRIECEPQLVARLKKAYFSNLVRNTNISSVWNELKAILEANQLQYIPLKGIYLSQYIYSDSTLRAMSDIDLLLHADDADFLYFKMLEKGAETSDASYSTDSKKTDHHLPGITYKGVYIEIHRNIVPDDATYKIPVDLLWSSSIRQGDIRSIHPHLNLIYFCLHLFYTVKRGGVRLSWLYDFIIFSQSAEFKNCKGDFMETLSRQGCKEPVLAVLFASEKLFNYTFSFIDHSFKTKAISAIERRVFYFLNSEGEGGTDYGYEIAFERLANTKGIRNKFRFIKERVYQPDSSLSSSAKRIVLLVARTIGMLRQKISSRIKFK